MARERQCEENKDQTWAWLWALPFTTYMTLNKSPHVCSQMGIGQMGITTLTWPLG